MARKRVINVTTATRTLSRNENGSIVVLDRAAGSVVTLPAASRGLEFQFVVKTAVTSNAYTVDGGTDEFRGVILSAQNNAASKSFTGDPASDVKITSNGTTTGGRVGSNFTVVCDTDGIWTAQGAMVSSTTAATPFSA
jgi:hypothetical protein